MKREAPDAICRYALSCHGTAVILVLDKRGVRPFHHYSDNEIRVIKGNKRGDVELGRQA